MTDLDVTVTDDVGNILAQLKVPQGSTPAQVGWATSPKHRFYTVPKAGDPTNQRFNPMIPAWEDDPARIEAELIATIKAEAERRKMTMATPGGMKKTEYAEKRAEVMAWKTLGANAATILAAFNLLPLAHRQTQFAHALADSEAFGDTPEKAIARFEAGLTAAAPTAKVAAAEAKACAAIRAASTAAAKRAAAAAVIWP